MNLPRTILIVGLLLSGLPCGAQSAAGAGQDAAARRARVQQYLRENKPELAIPELQKLVEQEPGDTSAVANLGVLLFFKGDCAAAMPHMRSALAQRPELWRVEVLLAVCERRQGDAAAARKDFATAFPHLEDEKLKLEAGGELVDLYLNAGEVAEAAPIIDALRASHPTDPHVLYMAYRIHTELAGAAMLGLSLAAPESAWMHEAMGHEKLHYGDVPGAIEQYRAALKADQKNAALHFELGEALSNSDKPADKLEAEREYRLSLEANPAEERAECKLGALELERDQLEQALGHFAHAAQVAPGDLDARLGLARTQLRMGRRDEAQKTLEEILRTEPENYSAHFFLGQVYARQGRKDEAGREIELYKKYKSMHEKLGGLFKQMRVTPPGTVKDEELEPGGK